MRNKTTIKLDITNLSKEELDKIKYSSFITIEGEAFIAKETAAELHTELEKRMDITLDDISPIEVISQTDKDLLTKTVEKLLLIGVVPRRLDVLYTDTEDGTVNYIVVERSFKLKGIYLRICELDQLISINTDRDKAIVNLLTV